MSAGCVIIGGGHGGVSLAGALRDAGYSQPVTVVDAGQGLPYERPPLSKKYLSGAASRDDIELRSAQFYRSADIRLLTGTRATFIDRASGTVTLRSGSDATSVLDYDHLVLATGGTPRVLTIPGAGLRGVFRLSTIEDADRLAEALDAAENLVIVGAGFIGLECAAAACARGLLPTVINAAGRSLDRAVSAPLAEYVTQWHKQNGVTFFENASLRGLLGLDGRVTAVIDSARRVHSADVVVVGIGAVPDTTLAEQAGLTVDGGVVVDEFLRTSDPRIFAIGDCARYPHALLGQTLRLESVQNATDHARAVAGALTGNAQPYRAVPWFWSDQGTLKLQIAGLSSAADQHVLRGDSAEGKFSVFSYRGDVLVGVDSVGKPGDHVQARRLLAERLSPSAVQVSDLTAPLNRLTAARSDGSMKDIRFST